MRFNSSTGKVEWSPEDKARHQVIREKFRHWHPTLEELLASGDYQGLAPFGEYYSLGIVLRELKQAREQARLSLADVAKRSGIDKAALSRLENGKQPNPTIDTLYRYAAALGKLLVLSTVDPPARPVTPTTNAKHTRGARKPAIARLKSGNKR